jgi:hypothetical protein
VDFVGKWGRREVILHFPDANDAARLSARDFLLSPLSFNFNKAGRARKSVDDGWLCPVGVQTSQLVISNFILILKTVGNL